MMQELAIYVIRPIKFSHVTHVVEEGWECKKCHRDSLAKDKAGMPSPRSCRKCHQNQEEIDEYLTPFVLEKKLLWTNVTKLHDDISFSHKSHYENEVDCEKCHLGIRENEAISIDLRTDKDECLDCHGENKVTGQCDHCHQTISDKWKPKSHEMNWTVFHGQTSRAGIEPPYINRCKLCHADASCDDCHRVTEPGDHNGHWRHRAHGIRANMDRDRCFVCHLGQTCESCHLETAPRTHNGSWGGSRNRHCMTCHFPLSSQGCYVCHKTDRSHLEAEIMPADITHAASNEDGCRTCHVGLGDWRHFDNGDNCRTCHR
jgi:Cytochrome c3